MEEREEDFRLWRDKVLLMVGIMGVIGISLAAVVLNIKSESLALAALTVFAGLLGAPTILRLDERRNRRNGGKT